MTLLADYCRTDLCTLTLLFCIAIDVYLQGFSSLSKVFIGFPIEASPKSFEKIIIDTRMDFDPTNFRTMVINYLKN